MRPRFRVSAMGGKRTPRGLSSVMPPFFRTRLRAVYAVLCQEHRRKGRYDRALAYLDRMERLEPLAAFEQASRGLLLLMKDDYDAAEGELTTVRENTIQATELEERYVHHFCASIIHAIDGKRREYSESVDAALQMPVRAIVRRWLPIEKRFLPFASIDLSSTTRH